jgi:hypothetical protein
MLSKQLTLGVFSSYKTTEIALHELKDYGFLMNRVSGCHHDHHGYFRGSYRWHLWQFDRY